MFWWYNMYSGADYGVTPRPMYPADGRKLPDVYSNPGSLRVDLQKELGTFPLFNFWGPRTTIKSSRWIADASKRVEELHSPTLSLVYLPHLDYGLQKYGPSDPRIQTDLKEIDAVCGDLIDFYENRGVQVVVLSEYGITDVSKPVHINRAFRDAGLIAVREELGLELLDPGASAAFAVADHQIAHIYVNKPEAMDKVRAILESLDGIERVLGRRGQDRVPPGPSPRRRSCCHRRCGRVVYLLLLARRRARAGFRPHGGNPPQARLRSGGVVHQS